MPKATAIPTDPSDLDPRVLSALERLLSVQRPVVLAHIRRIRRANPTASPAEIISILERHYLNTVTLAGAGVGAAAVVPGIGMVAALSLSAVETAGFLEVSALFAQSVTEVHGIATDDPERANTLVMSLMLGGAGADLVKQLAGQVGGGGTRTAFWGDLVTSSLPMAAVDQVRKRIQRMFLKRFVVRQGASVFGRLIPFGIGAVVGGTGNRLLGRRVIDSAREAFGPVPTTFSPALAALEQMPSREEIAADKAARADQRKVRRQAREDLKAAERDAKARADDLNG